MDVDADATLWLDAIATRSYASAKRLLRADQDVNVRGADGGTALHVVARHNALKKLQRLVRDGADPQLTDGHGRTPLRIAQRHNHAGVVEWLIYHAELLRAVGSHVGRTPTRADVSAAMQHKKMKHFREDVRFRVERDSSKLVAAARDGDCEAVTRMVEGAEITIDAVDTTTGETAFSAALAAGRRRVCEYLLANDAHLDAPCMVSGNCESVLATAVATGDVAFVRRLIARGALVNPHWNANGVDMRECPLARAVKSGSVEMVDVLLERGVRAVPSRAGLRLPRLASNAFDFRASDLVDESPWWLLAIACWCQDTHMIAHLFQTQVVLSDPSMLSRHGAHALFLAVFQANEAIVTDLLDRGVCINARIAKDVTAVVAAVAVDSIEMLELLLACGADAAVVHTAIEADTGYGQGLLATALFCGAMDCAPKLVTMETRPRHLDQALYVAAKRSDLEFARLLLDVALPSSAQALQRAIGRASCPLMLDLLLSRCCDERFDIAALNGTFAFECRRKSAEFLAVLLAFGIDITFDNPQEDLPRLDAALMLNYVHGVDVATLLLANGLELIPQRRFDATPLVARLETYWRVLSPHAHNRPYYKAGHDLLVAHGVLQ